MGWLTFIPLPLLIADLVLCREQRANRRDAFGALRQFSPEEQRRVRRALRRGEAVTDSKLAAATLNWIASLELKCLWGTLFRAVYLSTFVIAATFAVIAREWRAAAQILLGFDFFALLLGAADAAKRRAKLTEMATRALHSPGQSR